MNSPYRTPCNPYDCTNYTLDGCVTKCEKHVKYVSLKEQVRQEKTKRYQEAAHKANVVDERYRLERGNRHRVGQK